MTSFAMSCCESRKPDRVGGALRAPHDRARSARPTSRWLRSGSQNVRERSWIFSESHGLLNAAIGIFGLGPYKWLSGALLPYAIVIANVWGAIGEGMIIFLAGLQAVPRDYYEVARIEGATPLQNLIYITLPCMLPSLFFQSVLATIHAFQAFDYIYVLAKSGNGNSTFPTLVFSIYRSGFRFFRMGEAASQAVVLTLIILAFTLVYFQLQRRMGQAA